MSVGNQLAELVLATPHKGILAIDPGGTTGFAWVREDKSEIEFAMEAQADSVDFAESIILENRISYMVVERHIPLPGKRQGSEGMKTMELVGALESLGKRHGVEVVWHTASQMKSVSWCSYGKGVHAKDACKHLIRFLLDDAGDKGLIIMANGKKEL